MANQDNSDSRSKLEEEIKKLESLATGIEKIDLPEVKLDQLSYTPPSDDELKRIAESGLEEYRRKQTDAIKQNSADGEAQLISKREGYGTAVKDELNALEQTYKKAAQNIDDDILKRGLARSSVAVNSKSELENERARRASDITGEYGKKIAEIDAEIAAVNSKLNAALNDFNLTYAVKLNEKLDELKSARDKKSEEVIKYNNDIKAKQAALDENRLKTESGLYGDALSQKKQENSLEILTPDQRDAVYESVYNKMDEYLSSLTAHEAKLELRNHTLYRNHLSDYYFYKLYDKYGR